MMPTKKRSDVNAEDEMPRITRGVFCTSAVHSFLYHVNKHVLVKTRSYCTITVAEQIRLTRSIFSESYYVVLDSACFY